ncbi:heat shock factor-binding protein 1 [Pelodiscus sinensis]|uniref:heat shock factor-binding protein 1 n=1 Tax=Pelodiscus sinensis TaxID=13735 RepID=UPI003F6C1969
MLPLLARAASGAEISGRGADVPVSWRRLRGLTSAAAMAETDPKTVQDLTAVVQTLLQQMQDKFQTMSDQIIGRIDDMSCRIDDLEKNIADLMTQAGVEELEGENKMPATHKS